MAIEPNSIQLVVLGLMDLVFGSPIDFPLMVINGEYLPKYPAPEAFLEVNTSPYHLAKNFWAELFRKDPEYWNKLTRFIIWWTAFFKVKKLW